MDGQRQRPGGSRDGGCRDELGGMEPPKNSSLAPRSCLQRLFPPSLHTSNPMWHMGIKAGVRNWCLAGKKRASAHPKAAWTVLAGCLGLKGCSGLKDLLSPTTALMMPLALLQQLVSVPCQVSDRSRLPPLPAQLRETEARTKPPYPGSSHTKRDSASNQHPPSTGTRTRRRRMKLDKASNFLSPPSLPTFLFIPFYFPPPFSFLFQSN